MSDSTIGSEEIHHHLEILGRILETADADERRTLVVEGLSRFGPRFLTTLHFDEVWRGNPGFEQRMSALQEEASTVAANWLNGTTFLGSADEDERRARFGIWMLDLGEAGLARLIAKSILSLPDSHPLHDRDKAREALLRFLDYARTTNDREGEVLAIADLLREDLMDEAAALELIARGETLFPLVDAEEYGRDFLIEVFSFYQMQRRQAAATATEWQQKAQAVFDRIAAIGSTDEVRAKNMLITALHLNEAGDEAGAADAFHRAWSGGLLNRNATLLAAQLEARLRLTQASQEHVVVGILAPLIDQYEEQYLTAVGKAAVDESGDRFGDVTIDLAFAHAALGQWNEAVAAVERGKSRRLLHQSALRRSPAGAKLLELEEQLHALRRGVEPASTGRTLDRKEDWIGTELSAETRVLEEYRLARAALSGDLAGTTGLDEIAGSLLPGEVALLLGVSFKGTLIGGVMRGDASAPSITMLRPDLTLAWVGQQLLGDNDDGFILALEAGEAVRDPYVPLERLIATVDRELGTPLAELLDAHDVHRLVIVPHHLYNFVPLWALPAFRRFEVVVVPSAAHFVAARRSEPRPLRKAVVVGDPTSDLPISPAETKVVQDNLATAGIHIVSIAAAEATQETISRAARGAELFHFCGHGKAELMNALRAGLLVQPEWSHAPIAGPEALDRIVTTVTEWNKIDDEYRETDVAGVGHLIEYNNSDSGEQEYFLEYAVRGTLWARYARGQRLQIAELWTAGDLMVQRSFESCELALLSACSTSSGGLGNYQEAGGLPGALLLAGVSTIVATQWPVSDILSALYADLFYAELMAARGRRSVAAVVVAAAAALAGMTRDEAIARLTAMQGRLDDPLVDFEIEAYTLKLATGEPLPFAHPYAWASFHVVGRGDVLLHNGADHE